jgi:hypothetical protein
MKMKDIPAREKAFDSFESGLKKMGEDASRRPLKLATRDDKTKWVADRILSFLMPTLRQAQTIADRGSVQRDLSMVALALAAHKAEKGKYPDKLAELAPGILKQIPKDFFSGGKDFIYKPTATGYVLYSVGENLTDDGGKDKDHGGDDLVVEAK